MPSVCIYLQIHQPYRVRKTRIFDVGQATPYFEEAGDSRQNNRAILEKVAMKSYIPTLRLLREMLEREPRFTFAISLSLVAIEQLRAWAPEAIDLIRSMVDTGRLEILSETSHHSLSFLYSKQEFVRQLNAHKRVVEQLFGVKPTAFRNTELIYNNELAVFIEKLGYEAILCEGWDPLLGGRSPNFLYQAPNVSSIKTFTKNYRLSDDIAFRFTDAHRSGNPLTAEKFASWVHQTAGSGEVINLFMDFETFGEHQWADTGIFEFLAGLPGAILRHGDFDFATPTGAARRYPTRGIYDAHSPITWADTERDLTAWIGNSMQREALRHCYALEDRVLATRNHDVIEDWRKLQTSDHFYYMCTKWSADGDVHKYFSPYESPYEAFIAYNNALADLRTRL